MHQRYIFHTHTRLCKHAGGEVEDYCAEAVRQGVALLGMTDHTPYPDDAHWPTVRMRYSELGKYLADIERCRSAYAGRLTLLKGLEVENPPEMLDYIRETLLGECKLDYIICAMHSYYHDGECHSTWSDMDDTGLCRLTDHTIRAIGSGMYAFLAHPDLFGYSYRGWSDTVDSCCRAVCQAAVDIGMPLEINTYGMRKPMVLDGEKMRWKYPLTRFWEIAAEEGVAVLVNTDAHAPKDVWSNGDAGYEWAESFGLRIVNEKFATLFGQDAVYPVVPSERMKHVCYAERS